MNERPNILYLHSHDTGRYIQPYGYSARTPKLMALAEQGTLFRNAFSVAPSCSPSRSALLTGIYPHQNGMLGLAHRGFRLLDYKKHLLHALSSEGYESVLSGAQHIAPEGANLMGYDKVLDAPGPYHENAETLAAQYLANHPEKPFFLSVGFHETHREFPSVSATINPDHVRPPDIMPDVPEVRTDMASYLTMVETLDQKMGIVLDALDAAGLTDNTIVICTTDHGIAFPKMKGNLTHHGIGTMLIMRGPRIRRDRTVDCLVSQIDIFPTLCDMLGIQHPEWLQGQSFHDVLEGGTDSAREAVFSEVNVHATFDPMRAVRTNRWSYIRRYYSRELYRLPNCDNGFSKSYLIQNGWPENDPFPNEVLFDLMLDPNEQHNLAGSESHTEVMEEMRELLDQHMEATDDWLLTGKYPFPEAAQIQHPESQDRSDKPISLVDYLKELGIG